MPPTRTTPRRGFSLIEMLVVIGIILLLITLSLTVMGNVIGSARERATAATILKINGLLEQRADAFQRGMDGLVQRGQMEPLVRRKQLQLQSSGINGVSKEAREVMVRKDFFRQLFPQSFRELYGGDGAPGRATVDDDNNGTTDFLDPLKTQPDPGELGFTGSDDVLPIAQYLGTSLRQTTTTSPSNHQQVTESAGLLFLAMTKADVYGVAPVDPDAFNSTELMDTDNDGLLEFIDAWKHPLRFYRWPTRLIRPSPYPPNQSAGGSFPQPTQPSANWPVNRTVAGLLIFGLPPAPSISGDVDPLQRDPDDPTGYIFGNIQQGNLTYLRFDIGCGTPIAPLYHAADTYHAPLIVSAGSDEDGSGGGLGLFEPFNTQQFGHLAQPIQQSLSSLDNNPLTDNITNRNKQK